MPATPESKRFFNALGFALAQPIAGQIMSGSLTACEFGVHTRVRGDVVLCSRRQPVGDPGLIYGHALGVVTIADCVETTGKDAWLWQLRNPRWFPKPFPQRNAAPFFIVHVPIEFQALMPSPAERPEQAYLRLKSLPPLNPE